MPNWKPHPKQEEALLSEEYETLYGGARGGGKTDAGIVFMLTEPDPSLAMPYEVPEYRGLVLRRNHTDLKDWIDRAMAHYKPMGAVYVNGDTIVFPSGAKILLGHLADDKAYMKYQGHEYQRELIEELTQIPSEELYLKILSSCRSTNLNLRARFFGTANPGGPGHFWVKKRFVDPSRPGVPFKDIVSGRGRLYVPATVDDNPTLMERDPDYVNFLNSLPPDLRAYWRFGSWDYIKTKGAVFGDEIEQAHKENRIGFAPYNPDLKVMTFWDLGISKGNAQVCWFVQVDGQKINVIDLMWGENKRYGHWVSELADRGYKYSVHYLPHDGKKRAPDSLQSFEDALEAVKYNVVVITRTKDKVRDIQLAKIIFNRCHFNAATCAKGLEGLTLYRYEWDDVRGIFKDKPFHDWASNFGDAFEAMAVTLESETRPRANIENLMQEHLYQVQASTPDPVNDLMQRYLNQQPVDRASGF
jgi:hypothetical protein